MSNAVQPVENPVVDTVGVTVTPKKEKRPRKSRRLSAEDIQIVAALEAVRSDMDFLHNCFDQITEPILVDSLIYEMKAANLKYQYYISQCKQKGIVCGDIPELRR